MTAPALIPQADLTRAAKVAKAQECTIEISVGHTTYRITPATRDRKPDTSLDPKPEINL
jgi:hypothetical protein